MRAIVLIAAVSSLFGGMTLLSRVTRSQQVQAAPGVDVSALGKAIDAKSLPQKPRSSTLLTILAAQRHRNDQSAALVAP